MPSSCCNDCASSGLPQCEPIGYISTHGAYYSPSPNLASNKAEDEFTERAILLLTDDPFENSRILADNLAMRLDCDVWVPNYFQGPPLYTPNQDLKRIDGASLGCCGWLRAKLQRIVHLGIKSRTTVRDAKLSRFIQALQAEKDYSKIGAVGYCSAGSTAIRLASTGSIQSVVVCHPRNCKLLEVEAIKVPSSWICAEDDRFFSRSLQQKVQSAICRRKSVEHEFMKYKGTAHGFACRPDLTVTELKDAYENAFEQTVRWFSKTLPI